MHPQPSGSMMMYGNASGHSIFDETSEMKEEISQLKTKVLNVEEQMRVMLAEIPNNYLKIRNRFLDTYRRDVRLEVEFKGTAIIKSEDLAAHAGDAVHDGILYENRSREDFHIYRELYGLDPSIVLNYGKFYIIYSNILYAK